MNKHALRMVLAGLLVAVMGTGSPAISVHAQTPYLDCYPPAPWHKGCPWMTPRRPYAIQWGLPGDVPLTGDFDGDALIDLAVFRPATGQWFVRFRKHEYDLTNAWVHQWGLPGDVPMPSDQDGDGITDMVVYRPSSGTWYVSFSNGREFDSY